MPELPEVETIKREIEHSVGADKIEKIEVFQPQLREKVPADLPQKLKGACIEQYLRIGKYMVINTNKGLSIVWHLGMSGQVKIFDQKPSLIKHDHIIIKTANKYIVYNDARRFGLFTCCPTKNLQECKYFKNMGIDPFDKGLTAGFLQKKLKNKKTPIKIALLDQAIVCGIGNIYASEALFAAKILPLREAESLSLKECDSLIKAIINILNKAIAAGGSTLRDYHKTDGSLGYFQNLHCVYNKTGKRCPNCTCNLSKTGGITKIVQAGRSTFYCKIKQK